LGREEKDAGKEEGEEGERERRRMAEGEEQTTCAEGEGEVAGRDTKWHPATVRSGWPGRGELKARSNSGEFGGSSTRLRRIREVSEVKSSSTERRARREEDVRI
jgi:hypothetical protein